MNERTANHPRGLAAQTNSGVARPNGPNSRSEQEAALNRRLFSKLGTAMLCTLTLTVCSVNAATTDTPKPDAAVIEQTTEKGPVKLLVRITPKSPRLSDTLDLTLRIESVEGVEIIPPPFGESMGEFLVRDYTEKPVPPVPGKVAREFYYQLEPAHAGTHLIRSISAEFIDKRPVSDNKEARVLIESEPIEIEVTSDLGKATPSLTDLAAMHAPLDPPSRLQFWLTVFAGAIAGVIAALFVVHRLTRKGPPPVPIIRRSPEELAREALDRLLRENLHGKGLYKEFYVRLTGIVRTYIEATTGLHAPEQTTEEFLRDMRRKNVFPVERSLQLAEFLEAADLVKYAGQEPGPRQIQDAIARAQEFIGLPTALAGLPREVSVAAT